MAVYLDSSAIVKLALDEPESVALRRYLRRRRPLLSSGLARTEVFRALLPAGAESIERGRAVLRRLELHRVNDRVLDAAGTMAPAELRSLDAIHLATAARLGRAMRTFVTYDERMADAARGLGYRVLSPR